MLCSASQIAPYVIAHGGHAKCFSRGLFFRLFSIASFCSVLGAGDLASALLVCGGLPIFSLFRWAGATRSSCLSRFRAALFFALFMRLLLIIWTAMFVLSFSVHAHRIYAAGALALCRFPAYSARVSSGMLSTPMCSRQRRRWIDYMPPRTSAARAYDLHQAPDQ